MSSSADGLRASVRAEKVECAGRVDARNTAQGQRDRGALWGAALPFLHLGSTLSLVSVFCFFFCFFKSSTTAAVVSTRHHTVAFLMHQFR